ncbi:MAG: hypothetical protein AAF754_12755 [Pseudomonadota bacterium]
MADDYVDKVAGELADLALADERRSADNTIVDQIGEIVGASSQTLQEAFLTAVRVRRAESRARQLLADRATEQVNNATPLLADEQKQAPPEPGDTPDAADAARDNDGSDDVMEQIDNLIRPTRPERR